VSTVSIATSLLLVRHLAAGSSWLAAAKRGLDGKEFHPIPVTPTGLDSAVREHLDGILSQVRAVKADGTAYDLDGHYGFGVHVVQQLGEAFVCRFLVVDIDGPDHATGMSADDVQSCTATIYQELRVAGLEPFIERSHGGAGFHVWVVFAEPIPAGCAKLIGDCAVEAATKKEIKGVEVFPKRAVLQPGRRGSTICLPLPGKPPVSGGGAIVHVTGAPRSIDTLLTANTDSVAALLEAYCEFAALEDSLKAKRALVKSFYALIDKGKNVDAIHSDIDVETVARSFGEIVDDVTNPDVIQLRCPRHAGTSLYIGIDGWWRCHACGRAGGGPKAYLSLAQWLLPNETSDAVRRRLDDITTNNE